MPGPGRFRVLIGQHHEPAGWIVHLADGTIIDKDKDWLHEKGLKGEAVSVVERNRKEAELTKQAGVGGRVVKTVRKYGAPGSGGMQDTAGFRENGDVFFSHTDLEARFNGPAPTMRKFARIDEDGFEKGAELMQKSQALVQLREQNARLLTQLPAKALLQYAADQGVSLEGINRNDHRAVLAAVLKALDLPESAIEAA